MKENKISHRNDYVDATIVSEEAQPIRQKQKHLRKEIMSELFVASLALHCSWYLLLFLAQTILLILGTWQSINNILQFLIQQGSLFLSGLVSSFFIIYWTSDVFINTFTLFNWAHIAILIAVGIFAIIEHPHSQK